MSIFYLAGKSHLVEVYDDEALDLSCCGNPLKELKPNTVDAAKHEVTVSVGSVAHPMTEEHLINWVMLVTQHGAQRIDLTAVDAPTVTFRLADGDAPVKVLAYCNLHGLWQAEV